MRQLGPFFQDYMHRVFAGHLFAAEIPERTDIKAREQVLTRAHQNRTKCQVKPIDKPCEEILLNRCNSPADSYVPAICSFFRSPE